MNVVHLGKSQEKNVVNCFTIAVNNSCNKDVLGGLLSWTLTFNLGARYDFKKKNRNWGLFLNGPDENQAIKEGRFKFAVFIRSTPRRFPPKFIENTFFKLSRVLLDIQKCILGGAIKFVSVRSTQGKLSLFEISRDSVLFPRKCLMQFHISHILSYLSPRYDNFGTVRQAIA